MEGREGGREVGILRGKEDDWDTASGGRVEGGWREGGGRVVGKLQDDWGTASGGRVEGGWLEY